MFIFLIQKKNLKSCQLISLTYKFPSLHSTSSKKSNKINKRKQNTKELVKVNKEKNLASLSSVSRLSPLLYRLSSLSVVMSHKIPLTSLIAPENPQKVVTLRVWMSLKYYEERNFVSSYFGLPYTPISYF